MNLKLLFSLMLLCTISNSMRAQDTDISGAVVEIPSVTYNGTAQTATVSSVVIAGHGVIDPTCYDVATVSETNANTTGYDVAVTGKNGFTGTAVGKFKIKKKSVTITGITAEDKVFDGTYSASLNLSNVVISGVVEGDDLGVTATGTFPDRTAGTPRQVNISDYALTGEKAGNYSINDTYSQSRTSASITPKSITISWGLTDTWAYDGSSHKPTASIDSGQLIAGFDSNLTITGQQTAVGTYIATATPASYNYTIPSGNTKQFTITGTVTPAVAAEGEATLTYTVSDAEHATVSSINTADATSVTIAGDINGVPVTGIDGGVFTSENTSDVQVIDLSATQVALTGSRTTNSILKDIPENTLIYVPATSTVTGTNLITKDGENYTCADFQMTDGNSYRIPTAFTASNATLNRNFIKDITATLCLPFAIDASTIAEKGKIYYFSSVEGNKVFMTEETTGLKANTPYIFIPSASIDHITTTGTIPVDMSDTPQTVNATDNFTFVGLYATKVFTQDEINSGIYGFAASAGHGASYVGQFVKGTLNASIDAMRAYLSYSGTDLTDTETASAPSLHAADALPETMDVVLVDANGNNTRIAQLTLSRNHNIIYNLKGQQVSKSQKGLVISNGKIIISK